MDMNSRRRRDIEPGMMFPDCDWQILNEKTIRISDFRHKNPLIILYLADRSSTLPWIQAILSKADEFTSENVRLFVHGTATQLAEIVMPDQIKTWVKPGHDRCRTGGEIGTTIYLIDRYGEVMSRWDDTESDVQALIDQLIVELHYIELLCPE